MEKGFKTIAVVALIIAVLGVSIGFAALSTTLNINGTTTAKSNNWKIEMLNVDNKSGVTPTSQPAISGTTLNYAVDLNSPGDYYEFTVDVHNDGTLPAKLSAAPTVTGTSDYITHTVTYSDGTDIRKDDTLAVDETKTLKVRVEYKTDLTAETLPTTDAPTTFAVALTYIQG